MYVARNLTLLFLFAFLAVACSKDEAFDVSKGQGSEAQVYLVVSKPASSPATRAITTPTPGEDGDGHQFGTVDESTVDNIYAFFYDATAGDIYAADATTPVIGVYFSESEWESATQLGTSGTDTGITEDGETKYINRYQQTAKKTVPDLVLGSSYRVITIANCDDALLTKLKAIKTLGELRTATTAQTLPWTESNGSYTHFLMASENDAPVLNYTTASDASTPSATIDLERVAARVDCNLKSSDGTFTTDDGTTVTILGATLFNAANAAHTSYLLKRVTTRANLEAAVSKTTEEDKLKALAPTYLGDELPNDGNASKLPAKNYVVDPYTIEKAAQAGSKYNSGMWETYYDKLFAAITDTAAFYAAHKGDFVSLPASLPASTTDFATIGYTMENVAPKLDATTASTDISHFDTGIVFKAKYVKKQTVANSNVVYTYKGTVYSVNGTNKIASMLEKMLTDTYGTNTFSSWSDITSFYNKYKDNDPMGYAAYVYKYYTTYGGYSIDYFNGGYSYYGYTNDFSYSNYISGGGYFSLGNLYSQLNLSRGGDEREGYTYTPNSSSSQSSTYDLLKAMGFGTDVFTTNEKTDVYGYYVYYIRHADDGNADSEGIMEHAIVRNNLYQVTVNKISKIPSNPFTKEGIEIVVAVKNWNKLGEESIDF